jgi:outer membrane receptor protein involved in Fe transport
MNTAARMRLLVISMLSLLAVALLCASNAVYAATTGSVSGTVTHVDGTGIKGADVTLTNQAGANAGASAVSTSTNAGGSYTFVGVAPGTYTIAVAVKGFDSESSPVVVQQDFNSTVDFTMQPHKIGNATRIIAIPVRRSDPTTAYTVSSKVEQETKSQPNNLYQFPGLVFGQPGVTPDPSGYTHIRGSDYNQVGFEEDGIQITEPMTNSFATNLVTVGLKSANLYTGGADSSYGNATGGFINEVTASGKDYAIGDKLFGGNIEGTFGPDHGWNYTGSDDQFGGMTKNGKFDYLVSTIMFRNDFPGNTQIARLNSSIDAIGKVNYYADAKDTFTAFYQQGFEQYDDYLVPNGNPEQDDKFEATPTSGYASAVNLGTFQVPHDDQGYNFDYVSWKHNFNNSAYFTDRIYRLFNFVTFNEVSLNGVYENRHSDQLGEQLDYTNVLNTTNTVKAGFAYVPQTTQFNVIAGASAPIGTAAGDLQDYFEDLTSKIKPTQTTVYATDQVKTSDNKITLNAGFRAAQDQFDLNEGAGNESDSNPNGLTGSNGNTPGNYTDHYVDPRLGINISPSKDFTIRANASVDSQFPDTELIERMTPLQAGIPSTALSSAYQQSVLEGRYFNFNKLGTEHANDYDIGFEKSLSIANSPLAGAYDITLTTFQRKQYDLIQYTRPSYNPLAGARGYDNSGHGHASGVEAELTKRQVKQSDWNGYIGYTNQVAKATNSDFDTGYEPYFYYYNAGNPLISNSTFLTQDNTEVEPSYNQRHTIGIVVDKRATKLIEMAAFLDAGSGFPFAGGATSNGNYGGADAQHGESLYGSADFTEVPVLLPNGQLQPAGSTVIGHSGWHYKITLNTTFHITDSTSLFLNVDNVFDRLTVLTYATSTQAGQPYYHAPTAQYPQGWEYFGPSTTITPIFVSGGFRYKF